MTLTLGIDVDGVLADVMPQWLARCNAVLKENAQSAWDKGDYGKGVYHTWTPDEIDRWDFWNQIGISEERVWSMFTPDIYKDVLPYDGALEAIEQLRDVQGHEIVYVTSCETPEEYGAKVMWLGRHGFAKGCRTVGVGKWAGYKYKYEVPGLDWLVDDNVGHCTGFKGFALLVTRPHNKNDLYPGKRIRGIGDVPMLAQYGKPVRQPVAQADGDEGFNAPIPGLSNLEPCPYHFHVGCVREEGCTCDEPATLREQAVKSEVAAPESGPVLPSDWSSRKDIPLCTGVLDYFALALAEVARVSKAGNDQHNPGLPLHWARGKSTDHADCIVRHIVDRGTLDVDKQRHTAKAAWRALALLQEEMEDALAGRPGYANPNRRDGQTEQKAA